MTTTPPSDQIKLELPPAVVAAGKRTTLSFFLAHPSFVRGLRWVPGFRLERLMIGGKDFGSGTGLVDGRGYREHRVLIGEQVQMLMHNESPEDRTFAGSMTVEVSHVIEDSDYACGIEGDTPPPPALTCVSST